MLTVKETFNGYSLANSAGVIITFDSLFELAVWCSDNEQQVDNKKLQLAIDILANPGATLIVDNDSWYIHRPYPEDFDTWPPDRQDDWRDNESTLADSRTYQLGNCHGRGVLEALAHVFNLDVEDV